MNSLQNKMSLLSHLGECDHLKPHPIHSKTKYEYFNLTSWNEAWPPEIDWLDSYVNLSSYHPAVLEAITFGFQVTNYSKYFSSFEWGCIIMFQMDPDLADAYYIEHYSNANNTVYIVHRTFQ